MSSKLIILSQLFYPELISTGQTVTELAESLQSQGVEVDVLCGYPTLVQNKESVSKDFIYKGIRIRRLWSTRFPKIHTIGKLINHITFFCSILIYLFFKSSNSPVLVLTNPPFLPIACAIASVFKKITFHVLIFDVYPETAVASGLLSENSVFTRVWHALNRFVYRRSTSLIVIGRCMKDVLLSQVPPECHSKIQHIHVWADDKMIVEQKPERSSFVEKWSLEDKTVLLYSGNMGRFHDMETILDAALKLKDNQGIVFLFVGEGYKKKMVQDFINTHGLSNCQVHTYVAREQLSDLLACASMGLVSLLPSQLGYSVPSKSYGLLAAGIPILGVLPVKSEVARMIVEEECGVVVTPGNSQVLVDSILLLAKNTKKIFEMGENGKRAIQSHYNLKHAAQSFKQLIFEF